MRAHIIERLITSPCPANLALLLHVTGDSITPEAEHLAYKAHAVYRIRAKWLKSEASAATKREPPKEHLGWLPVCDGCGHGEEFPSIGIGWQPGTCCAVCNRPLPVSDNGMLSACAAHETQVERLRGRVERTHFEAGPMMSAEQAFGSL